MELTIKLDQEESNFMMEACQFGRMYARDPGNRLICASIEEKLIKAATNYLKSYQSKTEKRDSEF